MKIGIVVSRFNQEVTQKLYDSTLSQLKNDGIKIDNISIYWVSGAIEIPLIAQNIILTGKYNAIICLGAVIRGETNHYDYVCQQVSYGCQKISLDHNIPVIFGVLTTDTLDQALERSENGIYFAKTALDMVSLLKEIKGH